MPGIHYDLSANNVNYSQPTGWLQVETPYLTGPEVESVQRELTRFGYTSGPIDGIYGPKTAAAVTAFQRDQGLTADGIVGPETHSALFPGGVPAKPSPQETPITWACSSDWIVTGYYTPNQLDYPSVSMREIKIENTEHSFPDRFINAVRMEGWGRTLEGWCLGYYGGQYHNSQEPKDSKGRDLEQGFVAVDPDLISRGKRLKLEGIPLIDGRIFTAKDVGGAINDKHIDIYCGEGEAARQMTYSVTRNSGNLATVCVES